MPGTAPKTATRLLTGLRFAELADILASRTRAQAVRRWLLGGPGLPEQLPSRLAGVESGAWQRLAAHCRLPTADVNRAQTASDGTTKLLVSMARGSVETVVIPARGRTTVCVSSQVGCTRACRFCATARLGFSGHLMAGEIVAQVMLARRHAPTDAPLRNVVFMGMGEPMDNLDEVLPAIEIMTDLPGLGLAPSRVTVSTSGVVPGMRRFLRESQAALALSLNGSTDAQREALMPHTRTWPIPTLMEVLREDVSRGSGRTYFIEYVLFQGVNDADEDALRVVALLSGLPVRVNLIPHNTIADAVLGPPARERTLAFQHVLLGEGIRSMVRWPRGDEIAAACGQLARRSPESLPAQRAVSPHGTSPPNASGRPAQAK
ncbi:MAG: 23S rRNA (adenine(2503)-C(2))-methyltransferase RlmN [Myxococcaceae bacterium]